MKEIIKAFYNDPSIHIISSYYNDFKDAAFDMGFRSTIINDRDYHSITRDIVMSIQQFKNNKLTNLVFSHEQPYKLELADKEIAPYYSDYIEIKYIVEGQLYLNIESAECSFNEGDVCFIHSRAFHQELLDKSDCIVINFAIKSHLLDESYLSEVSLDSFQQFLRTNLIKLGKKENYVQFVPKEEQSEEINRYVTTIFYELLKQRVGYIEISKGYIFRLLDYLTRTYSYRFSENETKIYQKNLFEAVTKYMQNNLTNVTVEDLAKEFCFHPNYFNNLIKKQSGQTYSAYLIQLRINKAKDLLESTDLSVEEISWLVGYNNKGFFYKRFYEDVGMSPTKYRKSKKVNLNID